MCRSDSNPAGIGILVASVIYYYSNAVAVTNKQKKTFLIIGTNCQTDVCLSMKYATCILCLFLSELFTFSVDVGSWVHTEGVYFKALQ